LCQHDIVTLLLLLLLSLLQLLVLKVASNICCVEQCKAEHHGIVTDRYGTKPQLKAVTSNCINHSNTFRANSL